MLSAPCATSALRYQPFVHCRYSLASLSFSSANIRSAISVMSDKGCLWDVSSLFHFAINEFQHCLVK